MVQKKRNDSSTWILKLQLNPSTGLNNCTIRLVFVTVFLVVSEDISFTQIFNNIV